MACAAVVRTWRLDRSHAATATTDRAEKARQRGLLLELDDRLLQDIGVTREEARREARKPFWK